MFIKLITCKIKQEMREKFSTAQISWKESIKSDGLIAQTGGWNINDQNEACIIAFWENKSSIEYFMQNHHDKIAMINKQSETYSEIYVDHFNTILNMEGELSSIKEITKKSEFLRIADCYVKKEKILHFEKVQKNIWQPGMKSAKGMLGGKFSISDSEFNRYLVSTFWNNEINHKKYTETIFPNLKSESDSENDLEYISGKQIALVEEWKVF